jgi:hypothetical protein
MGEARVCIRCGTTALAGRNSCNECGGAIVYVATNDVPQPAYASVGGPPTGAGPAAPVDGVPFEPGEAQVAPELHRRSRNAVVAANFMIVFVVVAVVVIALVGWSAFGGGGSGGVPNELHAYANGSGGIPYTTPRFGVRLPDNYTVSSFDLPVGGYTVSMTGAVARVGNVTVGVASGSIQAGASSFALAHMPDVGQRLGASINLGAESLTVKAVSWHGRGAFDLTAKSDQIGTLYMRVAVLGNRIVAFVVGAKNGGERILHALADSYRDR